MINVTQEPAATAAKSTARPLAGAYAVALLLLALGLVGFWLTALPLI